MKRACSGLVSYSSSSSDESDVERDIKPRPAAVCESGPSTLDSGSEASLCPPAKKRCVSYSPHEETPFTDHDVDRKLPPLSASLTVPVPVDNPAEHQGRTRSFPHVEGQYAAYVYIPLVLESGDPLGDLVREVVCKVTEEVEGLRRIGEAPFVNKGGKFEEREDDRRDPLIADAPVGGETEGMSTDNNKRRRHDTKLELHISLSRPVLLRAYQRDEFKRTIKGIAESVAPFGASFTTFAELTNDERTRTFLAMEVGAGHVEPNVIIVTFSSIRYTDVLLSCDTYYISSHRRSAPFVRKNSIQIQDSMHQLHGPYWITPNARYTIECTGAHIAAFVDEGTILLIPRTTSFLPALSFNGISADISGYLSPYPRPSAYTGSRSQQHLWTASFDATYGRFHGG
ncbi:hypothetical protein ID866_2819 [Astraeus odoratus]|nr:hypothetical protein ID866_2819 [Astraeus odoratus]